MSYAIINGNTCWCSNTPPQQQIPDQTCNYICPGSIADSCGGPNVYAVYAGDGGIVSSDSKKASDTKTTPKPTETPPKTTKPGGSTTDGGKSTPDIDTQTVTAHGSTIIITSLVTPTPSGSLTPSSFGTVFITTTVGGSNDNGSTETATASPYVNGSLPTSDLGSGANSSSSTTNSGLSKGGVAGIVIAALVVVAAALFFFGYRRRNQQSFATARDAGATSTSSAEMAGIAAAGRSKWSTFRSRPATATPFRGPMDMRQTNDDSLIPTTKAPKAAHFRRTSTVTGAHDEEVLQQVVLPVDHRLDPRTMLMRLRESPGGESQTSLRDNMDYSRRVLHVVNGEESGEE